MIHPSFELNLDAERLFSWAHIPPVLPAVHPSSGTVYSHRKYPVLRLSRQGQREIVWMRQGLIPAYAHDEEGAQEREEAHAEALTCTSCYRSAFRRRRCIIPADQVTELQHGPDRQAGLCSLALGSGDVFGLAGVWETWENDNRHSVETFAVVTSPAPAVMLCFADRVPVVIAEADQGRWLYTGDVQEQPLDLLHALTPADLHTWRLSPCLTA